MAESLNATPETFASVSFDREIELAEAISELRARLAEAAGSVSHSISSLTASELPAQIESVASEIATDLKYAIQALSGLSTGPEAAGVYEGVASMAGHLLLGTEFLAGLTKAHHSDSEE